MAEIDDDYLVGVANKGLVKRAYKDKEEGNYQVLSIHEEAKITVGGETVLIRMPLSESRCSCPSRSICRHVVLGILALKEQVAEEGNAPTKQYAENELSVDGKDQSNRLIEVTESEQTIKESIPSQTKLQEEIAAYPFAAIKKVLGSKHFQAVRTQVRAKLIPKIIYSSVITVELPAQGHKVKLLSPLEYSTCTCHKTELCIHKAEALLWCKLEAGEITIKELEEDCDKSEYDREQIREAACQMKQFLEELLDTGLARISPDVMDYMERLAIISHNVRLANFEGYWRALRDSYESYLKRKASFQISVLMEQLARLYRRTQLLLEAEKDSALSDLAGGFKAEYMPVGTLDLIGIALERFKSQTGYEGETVYFLEEHTKQWYTFTSARPIFYEKSGRHGKPEKKPAPWGLPLTMEELAKAKVNLTDAKADMRRRLSSSQETRGWIAGNRKGADCLRLEDLGNWYYRDFAALFADQIGAKRTPWLKEQKVQTEGTDLVFLRPAYCERAVFSEAEQKLFLSLFDQENREVVVEVAYSKEESWGIRYLEQITNDTLPCFLGKIFFREGRVRMYPIAVFEKGELREDGL